VKSATELMASHIHAAIELNASWTAVGGQSQAKVYHHVASCPFRCWDTEIRTLVRCLGWVSFFISTSQAVGRRSWTWKLLAHIHLWKKAITRRTTLQGWLFRYIMV